MILRILCCKIIAQELYVIAESQRYSKHDNYESDDFVDCTGQDLEKSLVLIQEENFQEKTCILDLISDEEFSSNIQINSREHTETNKKPMKCITKKQDINVEEPKLEEAENGNF